MMIGRRVLCAIMACAALSAAESTKAEVVFNDTLPFSFSFFNECTGEVVLISGEFHRVVSIVETGDGTIQVRNNLTAHGWGVAVDSGDKYRWNDTVLTAQIDPPGLAFTVSQDSHTRLIGLGGTPNERIVATLDLDVDEFGVVTLVRIREVICQGD